MVVDSVTPRRPQKIEVKFPVCSQCRVVIYLFHCCKLVSTTALFSNLVVQFIFFCQPPSHVFFCRQFPLFYSQTPTPHIFCFNFWSAPLSISNGIALMGCESGSERVKTNYLCYILIKLKANRPHPRDYSTHRQRPWTDNDSSRKDRHTYPQTDGRTDGRMLPSALSPCFAKATRSIKTCTKV